MTDKTMTLDGLLATLRARDLFAEADFITRHLSQPAERGEAAWKAIVEQCVVSEAVTPNESDPYGTISQLIDYHVANTAPPPAAGVPDGWADAYAAFKGAFDTPVSHRKDDSEYAWDARRRLRDFNEAMLSATPSPTIADMANRLEVAERDAARYRYLKVEWLDKWTHRHTGHVAGCSFSFEGPSHDIDKDIDDAMQETGR